MTVDHRRWQGSLVKVLFQLEPGAWHGSATETLWAERVDPRRFRLRNVPFFVFGVSVEDVVFARAAEGIFEFEGISIRSGHSTYRIITKETGSAESFGQKWQVLEQLGCTYEQGPGCLKAVDVPPRANIYKVYELLEQGEREGVWEFEEGHCGHPLAG
jgi:hypothetical protein